ARGRCLWRVLLVFMCIFGGFYCYLCVYLEGFIGMYIFEGFFMNVNTQRMLLLYVYFELLCILLYMESFGVCIYIWRGRCPRDCLWVILLFGGFYCYLCIYVGFFIVIYVYVWGVLLLFMYMCGFFYCYLFINVEGDIVIFVCIIHK
ncbi:hypothetical protein B484DRAFT_340437, partial [Ochromonadaceae sp. CCMP2298]